MGTRRKKILARRKAAEFHCIGEDLEKAFQAIEQTSQPATETRAVAPTLAQDGRFGHGDGTLGVGG